MTRSMSDRQQGRMGSEVLLDKAGTMPGMLRARRKKVHGCRMMTSRIGID